MGVRIEGIESILIHRREKWWPVVFLCDSIAYLVLKQKKWSSEWSSQTVLFGAF